MGENNGQSEIRVQVDIPKERLKTSKALLESGEGYRKPQSNVYIISKWQLEILKEEGIEYILKE